MALAASLLVSACSKKPETLEDYAQRNSEISETISETNESSGVQIEINGNDIIYSYELSSIEGYSEEVVKNEAAVEALSDALDSSGENFVRICGSVEEAAGITGVRAIVSYTYKDKVVASRTFTADGASEQKDTKTKPDDTEDKGENDEDQ